MNRLCYVGRNLWVGAQSQCDHPPRRFFSVLHIRSVGQPPCGQTNPSDLSLTLTEREPLGPERIENIASWAVAGGFRPALIHCGAGMCRSPTAAIVALVARGDEPGVAMGFIAHAMWTEYVDEPITPWWEHAVMQEIFHWARERSRAT